MPDRRTATPTRSLLNQVLSRRSFLADAYTGLSGIGLASLLARDLPARGAESTTSPQHARLPHFAAKANKVLQIFCPGAASHIDLWEHKPELERWHGSLKNERFRRAAPASLEEARRVVAELVHHYNHVRLHSALGYITPAAKLAGLEQVIADERDRKLQEARERRRGRAA